MELSIAIHDSLDVARFIDAVLCEPRTISSATSIHIRSDFRVQCHIGSIDWQPIRSGRNSHLIADD